MPTPSLVPPKHSGTGLWIFAIVVMLAAIAGLLYWKFGRRPADTVMPPPPTTTPTSEAPLFESAPPPPPPEIPDAGSAPTKKRTSAGNACTGPCNGQVTPALQAALTGAARSAQGCYERSLRQNATLQGRIVVGVRVGPGGGSCGSNLVSDGLGDKDVIACVLQKFRSGTFTPPVGGCVDVQVPISFKPRTP